MMSGSSKGLPIKVPTIPIKVVTSNVTQVTFPLKNLSLVQCKQLTNRSQMTQP